MQRPSPWLASLYQRYFTSHSFWCVKVRNRYSFTHCWQISLVPHKMGINDCCFHFTMQNYKLVLIFVFFWMTCRFSYNSWCRY
jgi:hypothetical protein